MGSQQGLRNDRFKTLGAAFGAAAGSGSFARGIGQDDFSRQDEGCFTAGLQAGINQRSADYQRLLRTQAQVQQNFYAQAQGLLGGIGASSTTCSVGSIYPQWLHLAPDWLQHRIEAEIEERIYESKDTNQLAVVAQSDRANALPVENTDVSSAEELGYKAVELETHEDFAVKLAGRPKGE